MDCVKNVDVYCKLFSAHDPKILKELFPSHHVGVENS